jgi:hypothetical protein
MIRDLTTDQRLLGGGRQYGHLTLSDAHCERLRELSKACGGWIVFDDETEETWVPLAEWETRVESGPPRSSW